MMGGQTPLLATQVSSFASLPTIAKSMLNFVPQGWYLERKIVAELNGDDFSDTILVLTDNNQTTKSQAEGHRKIIILFGKSTGEFELNSVAHHVLWCEDCYGTLGGPGGNFPEIKVSKGVLSIYQSGGSSQAIDITLKFRYEPKSNKFRLIGKDSIVRNRPTGDGEIVSINYLSNYKKISNISFDRFGENEKITDKVEKIKPTMIYLEGYNIDEL